MSILDWWKGIMGLSQKPFPKKHGTTKKKVVKKKKKTTKKKGKK